MVESGRSQDAMSASAVGTAYCTGGAATRAARTPRNCRRQRWPRPRRTTRSRLFADRRRRLRARDRMRADRARSARCIYCVYVVPAEGVPLALCRSPSPASPRCAIARVPGGRHLPDPRLPPPDQSDGAAGLGLVDGLSARDRRLVLRQTRRDVLPRLARRPSSASACRAAGFARSSLYTLVRRWMREGRLTRRTVIVGGGDAGEGLIHALRSAAGQRRARRSACSTTAATIARRPPAAGFDEARHGRRLRRIRAPHPRRSRDLLAADLGREPHPADAEKALGAAGRYPAVGAFQQAAVPPPLLFLYRQRAGARRVRPADRGLGRRDEMAVRQDRRRPRVACRCCR